MYVCVNQNQHMIKYLHIQFYCDPIIMKLYNWPLAVVAHQQRDQ